MRAALRALSRTSGGIPFTFQGTPCFMRLPTFATMGRSGTDWPIPEPAFLT